MLGGLVANPAPFAPYRMLIRGVELEVREQSKGRIAKNLTITLPPSGSVGACVRAHPAGAYLVLLETDTQTLRIVELSQDGLRTLNWTVAVLPPEEEVMLTYTLVHDTLTAHVGQVSTSAHLPNRAGAGVGWAALRTELGRVHEA